MKHIEGSFMKIINEKREGAENKRFKDNKKIKKINLVKLGKAESFPYFSERLDSKKKRE